MNSSAVSGIFGLRRCLKFEISCIVTAEARDRASSVSLILATSSSSKSRTMNGDRPSVALSKEGRRIFPSLPRPVSFSF